jgi:hypothetical protein
VTSDVIPCDRDRDTNGSKTFDATTHSEKKTYLTIVLFGKCLC